MSALWQRPRPAPLARRAWRARARSRGISATSTVLESAMVMGWFVVLLLGEKAVSSAADARRFAETAAEESATKSSAGYCQAEGATVNKAQATAQPRSSGKPDAQSAVALVQALGLGGERTFPNYVKPLQNVASTATSSAEEVPGSVNPAGKRFEGQRDLGCLEKPLDAPKGSMEEYRKKLWTTNLQGY